MEPTTGARKLEQKLSILSSQHTHTHTHIPLGRSESPHPQITFPLIREVYSSLYIQTSLLHSDHLSSAWWKVTLSSETVRTTVM